jgi:hypothetical protein
MGKLRPITYQSLTDVHYDIKSRDITIKDGEQYNVAAKMFKEDSKREILYFYYWDDAALKENGFYTYSIDRKDIADYERMGMSFE